MQDGKDKVANNRSASGPVAAAQSAEPPLLCSQPEPGIVLITLNRPRSRNGLSLATLQALNGAIEEVSADRHAKVAILAANGPVFSSGHDLKEITQHAGDADGGRAFYAEAMATCCAVMQAIMACPKPVIAAVQGTATAAGCQLVATCDLAVAASGAMFCTPGVNIGLFCSTPMVALSRNVSRKRAMEMLLLGELIDAQTAAQWGLVNKVVQPPQLLDEAMRMARQIAAKSSVTVAIGKRTFYQQQERPLAEAYEIAARVMVENLLAQDAREGISAFLDKREPQWTGESRHGA